MHIRMCCECSNSWRLSTYTHSSTSISSTWILFSCTCRSYALARTVGLRPEPRQLSFTERSWWSDFAALRCKPSFQRMVGLFSHQGNRQFMYIHIHIHFRYMYICIYTQINMLIYACTHLRICSLYIHVYINVYIYIYYIIVSLVAC